MNNSEQLKSEIEEILEELIMDEFSKGCADRAISKLLALFQKERERVIEMVKNLDPLLAKCVWEDGSEIAYAVQEHIISNMREFFQ